MYDIVLFFLIKKKSKKRKKNINKIDGHKTRDREGDFILIKINAK